MYLPTASSGEALPSRERSKSIDPLYAIPSAYLGWGLAFSGHGAEGVTEARRAVELDSASEAVRNIFAATLLAAGRMDEAREWAHRMTVLTTNPRSLGFYAVVLASTGARDEADSIVQRLIWLPRKTLGVHGSIASSYHDLVDQTRAVWTMRH